MAIRYWKASALIAALAMQPCPGLPQPFDMGADEFAQSCASCHGKTGRGDGYLAKSLVIAPPDLTSIQSRNKGRFPVSEVYNMIVNGAAGAAVHATGQMPVWGARYSAEILRSLGEDPRHPSIVSEMELISRVNALVNYVMRLQVPAPADISAAFEIAGRQFPDILSIPPENLEFVIIVPVGFGLLGATLNMEFVERGSIRAGSGAYPLEGLAERDLVGGQKQYSFALARDQIAPLSTIFGNKRLVDTMKGAMAEEADNGTSSHTDHSLSMYLGGEFCRFGSVEVDESEFPSIHLRDRGTGAKYFEVTFPIPLMQIDWPEC